MINNLLNRRRLTIIPLLTAAGAIVFVFESMIPQPIPWAKLGLSNIAALMALYYFGFFEALAVSWLRVIIGGLFTGGLLSPAFVFGFTGGFFAVVMMSTAYFGMRNRFSPVGISVIGAVSHSIGQLAAAYFFFISHSGIWHLLPYMILTSILTGSVVGLIANEVLKRTIEIE